MAEYVRGMIRRERRYDNTANRPQHVEWVQPTGRNAISGGGLHPPYQETDRSVATMPRSGKQAGEGLARGYG
jgi:hypothetical protein